MTIVCRECNYTLTKAEVTGYVVSASSEKVFNFTKDVVLAYLQMKTKKNLQNDIEAFVENFAFSIANDQKIDCPVCFKYVGWIKNFDDEEVK